MIVNPRNAEAKDLSINNPLSQEVEVCQTSVDSDVRAHFDNVVDWCRIERYSAQDTTI